MKLFKTIILTATFALSMSAGNEKLTTQDKRDIVKKYEAMLLGMPSSEVKKVDPALYYFDEEEIDARIKRDPQSIFASLAQGVKRVKVTKIQGLNIQVTFSYKGTATHLSTASKIGYVQLAPNGKIKYDPSHVRHPLEVAYDLNSQLCGRYNWLAKLADEKKPNEQHMKTLAEDFRANIATLAETGVPLCGLNAETPAIEQRKQLVKFQKWLTKDAKSWDHGEPLTPLDKNRFKKLAQQAKYIELKRAP